MTVIEALLLPETLGLKAEIVTICSVAVHVALDQGFFDLNGILLAYDLRNDLIHGAPRATSSPRKRLSWHRAGGTGRSAYFGTTSSSPWRFRQRPSRISSPSSTATPASRCASGLMTAAVRGWLWCTTAAPQQRR